MAGKKQGLSISLQELLSNCIDPDQTHPYEQSDLGLNALLPLFSSHIQGKYGIILVPYLSGYKTGLSSF